MKSRIIKSKTELEKKYLHCLSIEMTRRCNMNCIHCARGDAQNVDITEEIIDKTLDEMSGVYISGIRLSGGEPLLAEKQIDYLFQEIIRRKIRVGSISIFTNGTIRSQLFVESCKRLLPYLRLSIEENLIDKVWADLYSSYNYFNSDRLINMIVSTYDHTTSDDDVGDTLEYYTSMINDNGFSAVSQTNSYKYKANNSSYAIEGKVIDNFDLLFGSTVPSNVRVIDNNYCFIRHMETDGEITGIATRKTLTVSANGNVFPGCLMPYNRVDCEKIFNIMDCNNDFFERIEAFCWEHPLNEEAKLIRENYKALKYCVSRGRKIEGYRGIDYTLADYHNSRIDRLEQVMKDMHKIFPYLYFEGIEAVATATVLLEMFEAGEPRGNIKLFARRCTGFEEDDIERLTPEWCRGFILFMSEKNNKLAKSARR